MDKQIKEHLKRRGIRPARSGAASGGARAEFFHWFHEEVMGFDSMDYRRRFWREALRNGRTVGPMPRTALEFTDPRLHPYAEWFQNLVFLVAVMGAAAIVWLLTRTVDAHVRRLRRPSYYDAERARRMKLAEERRRIRKRHTVNPCPTPDVLRAAFAHARRSTADMIRFGSMLEDLECHVDNSVIWSSGKGRIVGRRGGIRRWLAENAPDLSERYKTVMKYKALARRFRQAVGVQDPIPASAVLPPDAGKADGNAREHSSERKRGEGKGTAREVTAQEAAWRKREAAATAKAVAGMPGEAAKAVEAAAARAKELLGRCEGTVTSLAAQLARELSPDFVADENTVRTGGGEDAGRRRDSA